MRQSADAATAATGPATRQARRWTAAIIANASNAVPRQTAKGVGPRKSPSSALKAGSSEPMYDWP